MSYNVHLVQFISLNKWEDLGIFVETNAEGGGQLYRVVGSIQRGMEFQTSAMPRPDRTPCFESQACMGTIPARSLHLLEKTCLNVQPPAKQYELTVRLDPSRPLRQSRAWVNDVVAKLIADGIMQKSAEDDAPDAEADRPDQSGNGIEKENPVEQDK
ncbi:hypothetical protein NQ176_g2857 [Zarea fungicola]|uniref:Uncharacterized protein n=1 Tax=Zarea fungicola TaxID=93591 RepID=A0ACC1NMK1_9HYPO|nr:hypothetical protein NQ176_g2857 [Lecanicillium fungicola]